MASTSDELVDAPGVDDAPGTETPDIEVEPGDPTRWRRRLTAILVVVTSLTLLGAVFGVWSYNTLFYTDRFMATVEPTLNDPEFYEALGEFAADELIGVLGLEERFAARLRVVDDLLASLIRGALPPGELVDRLLAQVDRPTLAGLAPSLAEGLETRLRSAIVTFATSQGFMEFVPTVVEQAHAGVLALAFGDMDEVPSVYIERGDVHVNLLPLMARVLHAVAVHLGDVLPDINLPRIVSSHVDEARAQFREALGTRIPDEFGQVRLMSESSLDTVQAVSQRMRTIVWVWVALTVAMVITTVTTSLNRMRTSTYLTLGTAVALALGAGLTAYFEGVVLGALGARDGMLVSGFLGNVFSTIRDIVILLVIVAAFVAVWMRIAARPAAGSEPQPTPVPS